MDFESLSRILMVFGIMLLAVGFLLKNIPLLVLSAVVLIVRSAAGMRR